MFERLEVVSPTDPITPGDYRFQLRVRPARPDVDVRQAASAALARVVADFRSQIQFPYDLVVRSIKTQKTNGEYAITADVTIRQTTAAVPTVGPFQVVGWLLALIVAGCAAYLLIVISSQVYRVLRPVVPWLVLALAIGGTAALLYALWPKRKEKT